MKLDQNNSNFVEKNEFPRRESGQNLCTGRYHYASSARFPYIDGDWVVSQRALLVLACMNIKLLTKFGSRFYNCMFQIPKNKNALSRT